MMFIEQNFWQANQFTERQQKCAFTLIGVVFFKFGFTCFTLENNFISILIVFGS